MRRAFAVLCVLQSCTTPTQNLANPTNPPPGGLTEASVGRLGLTAELGDADADVYISDASSVSDPAMLLGTILTIRRESSGDCPTDWQDRVKPTGRVRLDIHGNPNLRKAVVIGDESAPELRASLLVNESLAQQLRLLGYLGASFTDTSLYSVVVTDQSKLKLNDSNEDFVAAFAEWASEKADLFNDSSVCWILRVDGVVHKTITRKRFVEGDYGGSVQAFGLRSSGKHYVSTDDYVLDHRIGLKLTVLKSPRSETAAH